MKLSKALKQKNRIIQRLNDVKETLRRENARRNDNPSTVDKKGLWDEILDLTQELVEIKSKICAANIGIYRKIAEMDECKSQIVYVQNVPRRVGPELVKIGGFGDTVKEYTWESFITNEFVDDEVEKLQARIAVLQDEVDDYNAKTDI
jgi:hypothetical protein